MSQTIDEFDKEANKIISNGIDELIDRFEIEKKKPDFTTEKMILLVASACMKTNRELLKKYHVDLMNHLKSKDI